MTIGTILDRYEVPSDIALRALERGAFVLKLKEVWVGPEITWTRLVKAVVFSSLGEQGAHIRKKIGLDKYIVTLIARGVPKFMETIVQSHDWYQKLYAYCVWQNDITERLDTQLWTRLQQEVESNMLHEVKNFNADPVVLEEVKKIEILHYKNPSV